MTELVVALVLGLVAVVVAAFLCRARGLEPGERLDRLHFAIYGRTRRGR